MSDSFVSRTPSQAHATPAGLSPRRQTTLRFLRLNRDHEYEGHTELSHASCRARFMRWQIAEIDDPSCHMLKVCPGCFGEIIANADTPYIQFSKPAARIPGFVNWTSTGFGPTTKRAAESRSRQARIGGRSPGSERGSEVAPLPGLAFQLSLITYFGGLKCSRSWEAVLPYWLRYALIAEVSCQISREGGKFSLWADISLLRTKEV
jgi:hypothetical protein